MTEWRATPAELARMHAAAAVVVECRRWFASSPVGVLGEIAAGDASLAEWRHYPAGEVYDPRSHAQYFYHVHPAAGRSAGEHGHFHTFLRAEGIPIGVAPLVLPETAVADAARPPPQAAPLKQGARDEVCHLVAITLDQAGEPVRLFATNRWVTGETWYRAEDVVRMLDGFAIGEDGQSPVLNQWVVAMIALFRPQIAALLRARDETMMAWRRRRRANVFEDVRLEVISSLEIDIDAQLALVERARSLASPDGLPQPPALPRMAEGWGEGHAG
ncbi:MAG: DUF6969 family protein [Stellaceae bacterium]